MSKVKCPDCGQKLTAVTQACPSCGHLFDQDSSNPGKNKSVKKTICICVSAIVCVAIISTSFTIWGPEIYNSIREPDETTTVTGSYNSYQSYADSEPEYDTTNQDTYSPIVESNYGVQDYTPYSADSNNSSYQSASTANRTPSSTQPSKKAESTKTTTSAHSQETTSKYSISGKEFNLFLDFQTQAITNHKYAIENLTYYLKTSDYDYVNNCYEFLKIAYEDVVQAYQMSLDYEELNPTSDDFKMSYDVLYDILTVDHSALEISDLIQESFTYLTNAFDKTKKIFSYLQNQ